VVIKGLGLGYFMCDDGIFFLIARLFDCVVDDSVGVAVEVLNSEKRWFL